MAGFGHEGPGDELEEVRGAGLVPGGAEVVVDFDAEDEVDGGRG